MYAKWLPSENKDFIIIIIIINQTDLGCFWCACAFPGSSQFHIHSCVDVVWFFGKFYLEASSVLQYPIQKSAKEIFSSGLLVSSGVGLVSSVLQHNPQCSPLGFGTDC